MQTDNSEKATEFSSYQHEYRDAARYGEDLVDIDRKLRFVDDEYANMVLEHCLHGSVAAVEQRHREGAENIRHVHKIHVMGKICAMDLLEDALKLRTQLYEAVRGIVGATAEAKEEDFSE